MRRLNAVVHTRLTRLERRAVEAIARGENITVAELLRRALLAFVERVKARPAA
jgi:hypothetical protein